MITIEQFKALSQARYSVRSYKNEAVPRELLTSVIDTALLAPSAVNYQPWTFVVVDDGEAVKQLQSAYPREWATTVPAFIVVCANHEQSWHRKSDNKDHADIDAAIVSEHICLATTAAGLGTCWICNFDVKLCSEQLQLPESVEPVVMIAIGYANDDVQAPIKKRKSLDEVIKWQKY